MAFRVRKLFGTFEKRAPGLKTFRELRETGPRSLYFRVQTSAWYPERLVQAKVLPITTRKPFPLHTAVQYITANYLGLCYREPLAIKLPVDIVVHFYWLFRAPAILNNSCFQKKVIVFNRGRYKCSRFVSLLCFEILKCKVSTARVQHRM